MQIKSVAVFHFPDNSFASTCRDVSRCTGWKEDSEYVWPRDWPEFKMKKVFKGPADKANRVRIVLDAALKAEGCRQEALTGISERRADFFAKLYANLD